jgi:GAF domain-containing protein
VAETVLRADSVVKALQGAFSRDVGRQALLQLAATKICDAGEPYTGVYMYMLHRDDLLKLEAYAGRPTDLTAIPVGAGMCGMAVAEARDLNLPDVSQVDGYLSCSLETKSELVVLVRRNDEILGQIDVDSDTVNGFNEAEQAAVKTVADALAVFL